MTAKNVSPSEVVAPARSIQPLAVRARDVAALLGVSERQLRRFDVDGLIPRAIKLRSVKLWPVEELRAWLAAGAPPRAAWDERCQARLRREAAAKIASSPKTP